MRRQQPAPSPPLPKAAPQPKETWPAAAEKVSGALLCLLLFLAPVGPLLQGTLTQVELLPLRLLAAVSLGSLVMLVGLRRVRPPGGLAEVLAPLLGVWGLLTMAWSFSRHDTLLTWSDLAGGVAVFLAARWHGGSPSWRSWLLGAVVSAATLVALLGIRNYAETFRQDPTWRIFGTFQNPNFLASYLTLGAPLTLALALGAVRPWVLPLSAAALAQFGALMLTGSRGGWLAIGVGMAVLLAFGARHLGQGRGGRLLLLLALLGALSPFLAFPTARRVATSGTGEQASSMAFRRLTWAGTLDLAADHPLLGTGLGTFEVAYPPHARVGYTKLAHNSYLQLAGETGLPGLLLFLALVIACAAGALRRPAAGLGPAWQRAGLLAAASGFLAHNLLESTLYVPSCLWTFLGLLALLGGPGLGNGKPSRGGTAWLWLSALAVLGAMAGMPAGVGDVYAEEAMRRRQAGDAVGALASLQEALRWSRDPSWRVLEAEALMATGRTEEGLDHLRRLAHDEPRRGQVHYRLGLALLRLDRPREALRPLRRAAELEPNRGEALVRLAEACQELGQPEEARKAYEQVARLEQSPVGRVRALAGYVDLYFAEAYLGLARMADQRGNPQDARRAARNALRLAEEFTRQVPNWKPKLEAIGQWSQEREQRAQEIAAEAKELLSG